MNSLLHKISSKALMALTLAFVMTLAGCGANDIYIGPGNGDENPLPGGDIYGQMESYTVTGVVTDSYGKPLQGISVISGSSSAVTSELGAYTLSMVDCVKERFIVTFTANGYFPVTKSAYKSGNGMAINVMMMSKNSYDTNVKTLKVSTGQRVEVKVGGVSLDFDGKFMNATTGSPYTGQVDMSLFYLSPENGNFEEYMPGGDLAAIDNNGRERALISYGMVNVVMTDPNGTPLQIEKGTNAKVTFSMPGIGVRSDETPEEIPLWSFDDSQGLWTYEGEATLQSDGTYTGEVSLLAWLNLDYPEDIAYVDGFVQNDLGELLSGVTVMVDDWKKVTTDASGYYKCMIPSNKEIIVSVPSKYYGNYQPEVRVKAGPVMPQSTERVDLTLPHLRKIYGDISYASGQTGVFLYQLNLNGEDSDQFYTDEEGRFSHYISTDIEGDAELTVLSAGSFKYTRQFMVEEIGDTYVQVVINAQVGTPDIVANCGNGEIYYLNVPRVYGDTLEGVLIVDSSFTATSGISSIGYDDSSSYFVMTFSGYAPSKINYRNVTFMAQAGGVMVVSNTAEGMVNYEAGTDAYVLNFSGKGQVVLYRNGETEVKQADIQVTNVGILHLATMESRTNYTPSSPYESFMPRLPQPAPLAVLITKSRKMGTGGSLYYNGGENDFYTLCNQAEAAGITAIEAPEFSYGGGEAFYYRAKDNTWIQIDADMYANPISSDALENLENENPFAPLEIEAPLSVTSLTGGSIPVGDLMDYSLMSRSSSQKNVAKNNNLKNSKVDNMDSSTDCLTSIDPVALLMQLRARAFIHLQQN